MRGRGGEAARLALWLIFLASIAVVGAALLSQYLGGLQPCELCLYERWPYYAAIGVSLAASVVGRRGTSIAAAALCAALFLAGAGLAAYHVGVEQHWIAGPTACTGTPLRGSVEDVMAQLLARQPVSCDEVQWSLWGVSLAGWNLLASLALAALAVGGLRKAL